MHLIRTEDVLEEVNTDSVNSPAQRPNIPSLPNGLQTRFNLNENLLSFIRSIQFSDPQRNINNEETTFSIGQVRNDLINLN